MSARLLRSLPEPLARSERRRAAELEFGQDLAARYASLSDPTLRARAASTRSCGRSTWCSRSRC